MSDDQIAKKIATLVFAASVSLMSVDAFAQATSTIGKIDESPRDVTLTIDVPETEHIKEFVEDNFFADDPKYILQSNVMSALEQNAAALDRLAEDDKEKVYSIAEAKEMLVLATTVQDLVAKLSGHISQLGGEEAVEKFLGKDGEGAELIIQMEELKKKVSEEILHELAENHFIDTSTIEGKQAAHFVNEYLEKKDAFLQEYDEYKNTGDKGDRPVGTLENMMDANYRVNLAMTNYLDAMNVGMGIEYDILSQGSTAWVESGFNQDRLGVMDKVTEIREEVKAENENIDIGLASGAALLEKLHAYRDYYENDPRSDEARKESGDETLQGVNMLRRDLVRAMDFYQGELSQIVNIEAGEDGMRYVNEGRVFDEGVRRVIAAEIQALAEHGEVKPPEEKKSWLDRLFGGDDKSQSGGGKSR